MLWLEVDSLVNGGVGTPIVSTKVEDWRGK